LQAWAAIGTATLTRDGQAADLRFDGRGNDERMSIRTLKATMPTGTLDAHGDVAWAPSCNGSSTRPRRFRPRLLSPPADGAISGGSR
jgi:translocation and assembly module TamB